MDDKLIQNLGLVPMSDVIEGEVVKAPTVPPTNDLTSSDLSYARTNMYSIIETGARALEELVDIASQTQHPRAFEVVATTMKVLMDANKDLVELAAKRDVMLKPGAAAGPQVVNNNMFVGTAADMIKALGQVNNNDKPD